MKKRLFLMSCAAIAAAGLPGTAHAQTSYQPYLGQIEVFGMNFCPRGWASASGQLIAISSNQALYSLLGTQYGGDGRTTFALPDLRGRVMVNQGNAPGGGTYSVGQRGGAEQTVLTNTNMPSHTHSMVLRARDVAATSDNPTNNLPADYPAGVNVYAAPPANVSMSGDAIAVGGTGSNLPYSNVQPYLTSNICIATQGIFPSRS